MLKPPRGTILEANGDPLLSGLVGYWPFNEGGGDRVHDLSGSKHHADFVGSPVWSALDCGVGLSFPDDDDGVHTAQADILQPPEITVVCRARINVGSDHMVLIENWPVSSNQGVIMEVQADNKPDFHVNDYSGAVRGDAMTVGVFQTLVGTFAQGVEKLYQDGIQTTSRGGQTLTYPGLGWGFGRWEHYGIQGDNSIEYVMIYNRALSAGDIWRLHHWPFWWADRRDPLRILAAG